MSLRLVLAQGSMPLGAFFGGLMAQAWGLGPMFLIVSFLPVILASWAYFQPALRKIDGELHPEQFCPE